jgi:hypothetical protein
MPEDMFHVTSMYGIQTDQPLVKIRMKDNTLFLPLKKAREIAMLILECAEAAEQDGALYNWALTHNFNKEQSAQLVLNLRIYREKKLMEDKLDEFDKLDAEENN